MMWTSASDQHFKAIIVRIVIEIDKLGFRFVIQFHRQEVERKDPYKWIFTSGLSVSHWQGWENQLL